MKVLMVIMVGLMVVAAGCKKGGSSTTVEGQNAMSLTLHQPSDVTLKRGEIEKIKIDVVRHNMTGPVTVSFQNLPKGVKVVDADKQIVGDNGEYNLQAAMDADLVANSQVTVTAKMPDGMGATKTFGITIKEAKEAATP